MEGGLSITLKIVYHGNLSGILSFSFYYCTFARQLSER